jgi:hypothetical protein
VPAGEILPDAAGGLGFGASDEVFAGELLSDAVGGLGFGAVSIGELLPDAAGGLGFGGFGFGGSGLGGLGFGAPGQLKLIRGSLVTTSNMAQSGWSSSVSLTSSNQKVGYLPLQNNLPHSKMFANSQCLPRLRLAASHWKASPSPLSKLRYCRLVASLLPLSQ